MGKNLDFVDEKVIKRPQDDQPLSNQQKKEWIRCATDKEYWMRKYAYVQSPKGKVLFHPRDYQNDILRTKNSDRFAIIVSPRQSGKTACLAIDALHSIIFTPDYNVGFTSYKQDNTKDVLDRIKYAYENLPYWMKPPVVKYNQSMIRFKHNSSLMIQVTKENTFRGFSLQEIIVDEFAFVNQRIAEDFWTSLLPSISADGEDSQTSLTIISTPNGTAGQFANLWFGAVNETNGFAWFLVDHERIPGRTEDFKKSMIAKLGLNKYRQEFECAFISDKGTLVNSMVIEQLKHEPPKSYFGEDLRIFVNTLAGRTLAMACDVSEGIGQDYHAIQIMDLDTFEQVAEFQNNILTQTQYVKEIIKIMEFLYNENIEELYYTIEANSIGQGVMRLIENSENDFLNRATLISEPDGKRLGLLTSSKSKLAGCMELKDMIEMHKIKLNSARLITELKFFIRKGASFGAEPGTHDDLVMAMVLMMNMLTQLTNYEDNVYDMVNEIDGLDVDEETWGIF